MNRLAISVVSLVLLWLIVGAFAAFGRSGGGYCADAVDYAQMVAWGPLGYVPVLEFLPGACDQPTQPTIRHSRSRVYLPPCPSSQRAGVLGNDCPPPEHMGSSAWASRHRAHRAPGVQRAGSRHFDVRKLGVSF
jgi:hypothetical protein